MEYMSAREAADKWGISQRRVAILCSEERVEQAQMVGNMWIIPKNAKKPEDARITRYMNSNEKNKAFFKMGRRKGTITFRNREILSVFGKLNKKVCRAICWRRSGII